MDAERFDAVARALTDSTSRRTALGLSLGGLLGGVGLLGIEAKRKKRKKKKKCKGGTKKCGKRCIAADGCCTDAECVGGATCQSNACVCPTECCVDADCPAAVNGTVCRAEACRGVCGTAPHPNTCFEPPSICTSNEQCCNDDCALGQDGVKRCTPSQLGEPCLARTYCAEGLVCRAHRCDPPSPVGGPCTTDGDCEGFGALCVHQRCA
jgi:hypothetical protein